MQRFCARRERPFDFTQGDRRTGSLRIRMGGAGFWEREDGSYATLRATGWRGVGEQKRASHVRPYRWKMTFEVMLLFVVYFCVAA